jgi:hypothetical protein
MTNETLLNIGFNIVPHFTIGNSVTYNLGRRRFLSASSVGTPNEFLYLYETSDEDDKKITDIICLHNYDYDGYLTEEKINGLIMWLEYENK